MLIKITDSELAELQNLLLKNNLNAVSIIDNLQKFVEILNTWQNNINLVSNQDLAKIWHRHILNSLDLLPFILNNKNINILDIGSGAGFPALVLAITTQNISNIKYFLVESNVKKASFLTFVASFLKLQNVVVLNKRLEDINLDDKIDIITARAVASLLNLINLSAPLFTKHNYALFLKGENYLKEIEEFKLASLKNNTKNNFLKNFSVNCVEIPNKKEVILKVMKIEQN